MRVIQLMRRSPQTCSAGDTLSKAAQKMWQRDCGCLPVVDAEGRGRLVGIVTDRDICMSALLQDKPLSTLLIADAMATDVKTCHSYDSAAHAETMMREAQVRRLPVVDAGVLVGMLTLADLARAAAREQCSPHRRVTADEVGTTLASICR
jgi:CBS domain-containing protein